MPSSDLKQIKTPSPTASALGQYGNTPVGLYTGSAQVNVPLYEIKEGSLTLPISLSYNSGGIKVADMASWVGTGFSLNAGGSISRTVYGLPDEQQRTNPNYSLPASPTAGQMKDELMNIVDYQPDVFYFNFNGKTGKFTIGNTSTISISPHQNLKIQAYYSNGLVLDPPFYSLGTSLMFRITDENGIVYEFKDYETNRTVSFNPDVVQDPIVGGIGVPLASATAWYLTDMYSPTGDTIKFVYTNYGLLYDLPSSEQQFVYESDNVFTSVDPPTQQNLVKNATRCQNQNLRLQKIVFSNGYINFYAAQARKDLIGDSALTQMTIFRKDSTPVKGYAFKYGYGTGIDTSGPTPNMDNSYSSYIYNLSSSSYLRLMLMQVDELDDNYVADGRNYTFDYNNYGGGLPSRFSTQRDWWGYYNGNGYTSQDFLTYQLVGSTSDPNSFMITGKEPDSNYCKQNSLSKITYPTGGYTQFNYELHSAYIGKGLLPPVVTSQQVSLAIDFTGYPDGYSDTTINGLNCVYKIFSFASDTGAAANITISNIMYQQGIHPLLRFDIYDSTNQVFLSMNDLEGNVATTTTYVDNTVGGQTYRAYTYALTNYHFPHGTYRVIFFPIASFIGNNTYLTDYLHQPNFQMTGWSEITYSKDTVDISRYIGGLRIRSIFDYDPVTNRYQEKDYNYNQINSNLSSGSLVSGASYIYPLTEFVISVPADGSSPQAFPYKYMVLNSESNYALSTTQGSYVGYSTVTETSVDPASGIPNGKSEYYYTSADQFPDAYGYAASLVDNFPYPPADTRDWQRGLLRKRVDYQYLNGQYIPIKVENNVYGTPVYVDSTMGYISRYVEEVFPSFADTGATFVTIDGTPIAPNPEAFFGERYRMTGGYVPLLSKFTTMIQNGDSITQAQYFTYADAPANMLPTHIEAVDSKGNFNDTYLKYPFDYVLNNPTTSQGQGILNLQQHHLLSPVVEKYIIKDSGYYATPIGAISGIYTTFKPSHVLPDTVFRLESAAPVLNYSPISLSDAGTVMDAHYAPRLSFSAFDNYGNLLQQQKVNDMAQSYVWDYYHKFPIAAVVNAAISDIAYTSFEADGTGNWSVSGGTVDATQSITGRNSYLNGTLSKSGLNSATTYIVSYWSENGAYSIPGTISGYPVQGKAISINNYSWTLYVHKVTGQSTITISPSGHIDELRLYPATAQMTTYTYDPLIGMTSQMDAGNRATYYEYDGLARLKRVRDQDYNILKTLEYQYQSPAGCGGNCYSVAMQTFAGTHTISYPVGVFDVNGQLLGNASTASAYVSLWNNDTADSRVGTLAAGKDSMHFNITVNTGQTLPSGVTGLRYYQMDLPWNQFDAARQFNAAYIDFGDGAGIRMPANETDTPSVHPPNTVYVAYFENIFVNLPGYYFVHNYPDNSLKTITCYHNDGAENSDFDNSDNPATCLTKLQNLRGYLPANTNAIGGSSYQQGSMTSLQNILNWNSITSVQYFILNNGDFGVNSCTNISYAQDFMANNKGLKYISTRWATVFGSGDPTFKISRLKSDWNTYFTQLQYLWIAERDWDHEDLSALTHLNSFSLQASDADGGINPNGPFAPLSTTEVDTILIQIANGAGRSVSNGYLSIGTGGSGRTSTSQTAVDQLKGKGWQVYIDNVLQ